MKNISPKVVFYTLILLVQLISIVLMSPQTNAATTTLIYAWTANDIWWGSFSWSNPSNATLNTTTTSATSTISTRNAYSNYLSLTNFNLAWAWLPSNAQINGIQVEVERNVSNNRMRDTTVQLTKDWTNLVWNNYWNNSNGPTGKTITTYWWLTDLWWTTWSSADLLSSNFWVALRYQYTRNRSANVNVYRVRITVDYTILTETLPWDTLDFETAWWYTVTGGTWTRTTNNPYEWSYSIESWNHTDNTSSCFQVTKDIIEDSTVSFYKNVSSEASYDFLRFYINWVQQDQWSWEVAWSQSSYNVSAWFNTFEWCYEKDYSVSNGSDTAWVDLIEVKPVSTPGWVGWMRLWLKADAWTSTNTHWVSLNTWSDQSWNWLDATAWVAPTYLYNDTNNLNFNPLIDFNWNQYLENINNWVYTQSYFAVIVPDSQVDWTLTWQVPFAFDCDEAIYNTWNCWLPFWWLVLWAFTAAINDEVITHAIWASTDWRSAQIWQASYKANKPMLINMNENADWNWTEIREKWINLNNYSANTYQTLGATDYRLWMSTDSSNPFPFNWKIAEIINYDLRLDDTQKQNIESYLSIKYGITLAWGSLNYIASDWTTNFWSTSSAWLYKHDIFGIWRDDSSSLSQVKSKSVNDDGVITIEAIWEWTNINPSFTDIDDIEALLISNNDLWNTWTQNDAPSWYYILERQWRVQETWEVGTINLDFDMANPNFDIPDPSLGTDYYFIYDSDNDNSLSDETPQAMTNTTWDIWQIAWVNLDNLREFTIASQASTNNIPTDIALSNNSIDENVAPNTNIWTFTTVDADSWDSHTYSLVVWSWDQDNQYMNIVWNTLQIIHSPDYEIKQTYNIRVQTDDWNWWQYQEAFIININNLWEAIPSSLDFENVLDDYKYTNTSWNWTRTTNNPYEWLYSLESNNWWVANTQSCFEVNNTLTQTWTINFYYNVSSQAGSDYLRFYVNNIEQQAWSWTVPWTLYEKTDVPPWSNIYKWCYIKDASGSSWTDNAYIDFVATQPTTSETIPPTIISINYPSWTLLPWWNHNIIINYQDLESWIDTNSDSIALYKWNGSSWWSDISSTWLNLWWKIITTSYARYTTNNLSFWKYRYDFSISDMDWNSSSIETVFYIDEPELIVNTWSVDIWNLKSWSNYFSSTELEITIKTVWAWFDLVLNKLWPVVYDIFEIVDYNWVNWVWYDKDPYTSTIHKINPGEIIATQLWSINFNWNKNTYIYKIRMWASVWKEQAAWNYAWSIKFRLDLDY